MRLALIELHDHHPGVLQSYPGTQGTEEREPPFFITVAAWALDDAADLHRRFGDAVQLTVGALGYPDPTQPGRHRPPGPRSSGCPAYRPSWLPRLPPELVATLAGPLEVASGHHGSGPLLLENRGAEDVVVNTHGGVTGLVVDPGNDRVLGGLAGAQFTPLLRVAAPAGGSVALRLLTGAVSTVADLGWSIPPGRYGVEGLMDLEVGGRRRTSVLPLTVV